MRHRRRDRVMMGAIVGASVFALTAHNMALPLVPLAAVKVGAGAAGVGLASGAWGILAFLCALPVGRVIDRLGPASVAMWGSLLMALSTAALALPTDLSGLVAAQAARGLGQLGFVVGIQGLIATMTESGWTRERAYGTYIMALSATQLLGPIVGAWIASAAGLAAAFYSGGAAAAIATIVCLPLGRGRPPAGPRSTARLGDVLADRPMWLGVFSSAAVLAVAAVGTSFYPVFLVSAGKPIAVIGLLLGIRGAAAMLCRPLLPLLQRCGTRSQLLGATLVAATVGTATIPLSTAFAPLCLEAVAMGFAMGLNAPLSMALVADRAYERENVGLALRVGGNRFFQFTSPLVLGMLAEYGGLISTFLVAGLIPLVALGIFGRWSTWRDAGTPERPA